MISKQTITLIIASCALIVALAPLALFVGYALPVLRRIDTAHDSTTIATTAAAASTTFAHSQAPIPPHQDHKHHLEQMKAELTSAVKEAVSAASAASSLPSKFNAGAGLPRYYQEDRGTCWAFSTIGMLEENYRLQGMGKGFLKSGDYVRFSQQAYGIAVIDACKGHPDICDVVGDFVYENSTEGGEVWWLYHLTDLYTKILPHSVCPYDPSGVHEHECPGMTEALKKNPIRFSINSYQTAYTIEDTKKLIYEKKVPLSWSSEMFEQNYYFSCDDQYWASRDECSDAKAVDCPTDRYYGGAKKCALVQGSMFDMDGEFVQSGEVVSGGGHAMLVHGWNDEFVTKNGEKGGFIIKNSWHDQTYGSDPSGRGARGSHSVAYWMNQISQWDDKKICPGPLNPENWLSCVNMEAGPHGDVRPLKNVKKVGDTYDLTDTCLNKPWMDHLVDLSLQPNEFQCVDAKWCHVNDPSYRYFLIEMHRNAEQNLEKACMLEYNVNTKAQKTICTPYLIPAQIAYFFKPIQAQLDKLVDSEDLCGYWFWSYDATNKVAGNYQNWYTTWFDVAWEPSSYLVNAPKYPQYDYTLLKSSSGVLQQAAFYGPSPFAQKRY